MELDYSCDYAIHTEHLPRWLGQFRNGRPTGVPGIGEFAAFRDGGDTAYAEKYSADYAKRLPQELY